MGIVEIEKLFLENTPTFMIFKNPLKQKYLQIFLSDDEKKIDSTERLTDL